MKRALGLVVICGGLVVTSCHPQAIATENTTIPTSTSRPSDAEEGIDMFDPTAITDAQALKMIALAKASLARKFNIGENQIHLSSVGAVTWPDAGLGCPQAGVIYAEVITPGYQILFEAQGKIFSYHTDSTERVILCEVRPPNEIFLPP